MKERKLKWWSLFVSSLILSFTLTTKVMAGTKIQFKTSLGDIVIELADKEAPITVKNILRYVDTKHYDGTIFHRIIKGFVVQGGGYKDNFPARHQVEGVNYDPIKNEADNGLKNVRGSLSMARTSDPDSASTQFFINLADNTSLDHKSKDVNGWGYAVFGNVISGMEFVDKMAKVATDGQDKPRVDILINTATRVE